MALVRTETTSYKQIMMNLIVHKVSVRYFLFALVIVKAIVPEDFKYMSSRRSYCKKNSGCYVFSDVKETAWRNTKHAYKQAEPLNPALPFNSCRSMCIYTVCRH